MGHLDYLQSLGLTTVWITPVYSNAGESDNYHGYGATDLYAVDPHFGTLADLRARAGIRGRVVRDDLTAMAESLRQDSRYPRQSDWLPSSAVTTQSAS